MRTCFSTNDCPAKDATFAASIVLGSTRVTEAAQLGCCGQCLTAVLSGWVGRAWAPSTAYTAGDRVSNGGNVYVCTADGASAGAGGPSGTSTGIIDGTVTWDYVGSAQPFQRAA